MLIYVFGIECFGLAVFAVVDYVVSRSLSQLFVVDLCLALTPTEKIFESLLKQLCSSCGDHVGLIDRTL